MRNKNSIGNFNLPVFKENIISNILRNLSLSTSTINENNNINDIIGTLSALGTGTIVFSLAAGGIDNSSFNINQNELRASIIFDADTKSSYSIIIQADNGIDTPIQLVFNISISNLADIAPVASNVSIDNTSPKVDDVLTLSYTYTANEGGVEGVSTFRWLLDNVVIAGETSNTYTVLIGDVNGRIKGEVTPVGTVLTGNPVQSAETGVVSDDTVIIDIGFRHTTATASTTNNNSINELIKPIFSIADLEDINGNLTGISLVMSNNNNVGHLSNSLATSNPIFTDITLSTYLHGTRVIENNSGDETLIFTGIPQTAGNIKIEFIGSTSVGNALNRIGVFMAGGNGGELTTDYDASITFNALNNNSNFELSGLTLVDNVLNCKLRAIGTATSNNRVLINALRLSYSTASTPIVPELSLSLVDGVLVLDYDIENEQNKEPEIENIVISGIERQGDTLTANVISILNSPGTLVSTSYQWYRILSNTGNPILISGATSQQYIPVLADVGSRLLVKSRITQSRGINNISPEFTSIKTGVIGSEFIAGTRTFKFNLGNNSLATVPEYVNMNGSNDGDGAFIQAIDTNGTPSAIELFNGGNWTGFIDNGTTNPQGQGNPDLIDGLINSGHRTSANTLLNKRKGFRNLIQGKVYEIDIISIGNTTDTINYNINFYITDNNGLSNPAVIVDPVTNKSTPSLIKLSNQIIPTSINNDCFIDCQSSGDVIINTIILTERDPV